MEQEKRLHVTCDGVAGGAGALLHGHLHRGDGHQDRGHGLRPPPGLLSQERMEHHGLHCGRVRVSTVHNLVRIGLLAVSLPTGTKAEYHQDTIVRLRSNTL